MSEDLGMLYLPTLGIFTKVYQDKKGMYVKLPNSKKKFHFQTEEDTCNKTKKDGERESI